MPESSESPAPSATPTPSPVAELAWRWKLARCAALRTVLAEAGSPAAEAPTARDTDELVLVRLAALADPAAALTRVFDNSRILGLAEGALHYRLHAAGGSCGGCASVNPADADLLDLAGLTPASGGGLDVAVVLAHALKRRFPTLLLRDASPRPVMGAS